MSEYSTYAQCFIFLYFCTDVTFVMSWQSGCCFAGRLVPGPNLGAASTNRDLRLYPEVCFSCIVTNLHLPVIFSQDC